MTAPKPVRLLDRRTFLMGAGALVLAACSETVGQDATPTSSTTAATASPGSATDGSGSDDAPTTTASSADIVALTPAMFADLAVCQLTPSAAEGPFPSIEQLDRRDVHEGYPGHPLRLGVQVVDGECNPVPDARVEIWHTDASGDYSSYTDNGSGKDEGEGTTFCRGVQTSDQNGLLEFQTIYPGWYEGRAVHIHTTVWLGDQRALTGQLYLDEAYSDAIYAEGEYAQFGSADTAWSDDGLIGDPTSDGTLISLSPAATYLGDGTLGLITLGIEA